MAKRPIPPNKLSELRAARGWSMQAVADAIGKDASYIYKLEKLKQRIPADALMQIAELFDVTTDEVLTVDQVSRSPLVKPVSAKRITPAPANDDVLQAKIPVYGTAAGSHVRGASQMLEGPVDYIDAPRALENAQGLYGIYVLGDSMDPMYPHGSVCIASKFKPPKVGRGVVVEEQRSEHAPIEATIGILHQQTAEKIILRKLNPDTRVEIPVKYIKRLHKVLDMGEILGVA